MRIGGFGKEDIEQKMEPVYGMEEPWHYRNKAQFPVGYDKEGNLVAGFYAAVPTPSWPIQIVRFRQK